MSDNLEKLSYRELAERLGISPDAARMKAKRMVKSGHWRIIPGNHPSERVFIELPAADLNAPRRVPPPQDTESRAERLPREEALNQVNEQSERLLDELAAARSRIDELTDLIFAARDVLIAAQESQAQLRREVADAQSETAAARLSVVEAQKEALAVQEAHRRDGMELTAAEMREMGTKAELERALADVGALKDQLRLLMKRRRQPWWQRMFGS